VNGDKLFTLFVLQKCAITGDKKVIDDFIHFKQSEITVDKDGKLVYIATSEWFLNTERQNNPDSEFHFTSEFKTATTGNYTVL
jgi:peptide chain release factor 3